MTKDTNETGPIYGVTLIDELPLGGGAMYQAMPSRRELELARWFDCEPLVAGYEVLLEHWRRRGDALERAVRLLSVCEFTESADLDDLDTIHRVAAQGSEG